MMLDLQQLNEIAGVLKAARRILVMSHISPDGDAIGSLLGLGWILRSLPASPMTGEQREDGTRSIVLALADRVPAHFSHLPGAGEIVSVLPASDWDAVVTLDASDTQRLGSCFVPESFGTATIVNIDHHVTNVRFGQLNLVAPAAATAQIIVALADTLGAEIPQPAATCLLTGIVTDTNGFRTSNVDVHVMATVVRLMELGANLGEITERSLNYIPECMLGVWGAALAGVEIVDKVIFTSITQEMRSRFCAHEYGDNGLVSFLLNTPNATVAAVFSEKSDGSVEIGFRSRPGFDVSQVAFSLGGGGHPQASGCTIAGPLAAAQSRVIPLLVAASTERFDRR